MKKYLHIGHGFVWKIIIIKSVKFFQKNFNNLFTLFYQNL